MTHGVSQAVAGGGLKARLEREDGYLRDDAADGQPIEGMIGASPAFRTPLDQLARVAATDATVLIVGETGTGKELLARAVHRMSRRGGRPLITVNCAAISAGLVESELFGHEKGAFTGAVQRREGRFEVADRGTIFLDEIGELPLDTQAKLLRVLQEREFERVGSSRTLSVDVRLIAATNRDLEEQVSAGAIRADLFYRLNVFPVRVPPLRDRPEDVLLIAEEFLRRMGVTLGRHFDPLGPDTRARLLAYPWPGNVRELQNVIERAAILSNGPQLELPDGFGGGAATAAAGPGRFEPLTLEAMGRRHITEVLAHTGWVIEGEGGAAAILGLNPKTLRSKIRKLGITRQPSVPGR